MPPPWHLVVVPDGVEGVPTVGLTVTVRFELVEEFPHGLVANTEIVAVPLKPAAHVTVPEEPVPEMVFPEPLTVQL